MVTQSSTGTAAGRMRGSVPHATNNISCWASKVLCCRYVLVAFKTVSIPVSLGDSVARLPWRWAFGLFRRDEYEIVGVWPARLSAAQVARDMEERGLVRIAAVVPDAGFECSSVFPRAVRVSAIEGDPPPTTSRELGPQQEAELRSVVMQVEQLQRSIDRAIKRQTPFADESAAAEFLAVTLERGERGLRARMSRLRPAGS